MKQATNSRNPFANTLKRSRDDIIEGEKEREGWEGFRNQEANEANVEIPKMPRQNFPRLGIPWKVFNRIRVTFKLSIPYIE